MDVEKNWATIKRGEVFRALSTRPEGWRFNGVVRYSQHPCELCGTPIVWRYALVEKEGALRTLWVGSECIKWYYEAYMPNGLQMALEMLKKATRVIKQGLIAQRLEEFKEEGFGDVVDYLLGPERRGYRDVVLGCLAPMGEDRAVGYQRVRVSKFRASIRRKGYLKPEELEVFTTGYNVSRWGKPYADSKMKEVQV